MKTISLETENAVIGAMLVGGIKTFHKVSSIISAKDFYQLENQILFNAIETAVDQKLSIDPVTIAETLTSANLSHIGGMQYITQIISETPSTANAGAYARIVLDNSQLRSLVNAGTSIIELSTGEESTVEKIAKAQEVVGDIAKTQRQDDKDTPQATKEFIEWMQREDSELKSGFFDQHTGGLFAGLIVIAAGTGQGKSTLALNIAYNLREKHIAYYSLEMPAAQLIGRMVSNDSGLPYQKIRDKTLNVSEWPILAESVKKIKDSNIRFIDNGIHINQLCAHARSMKNNKSLDMIIVDYIQLVGSDGQNREREVATITRKLKGLSMDLDVPVIALSQLSRDHEKRSNPKPTLKDLRESGAVEQDSDLVLFLYDESKYKDETQNQGLTELYSCKFRHGENFTLALDQQLANYRFKVSEAFIQKDQQQGYKL
jgi:replicative DNA helicase